MFDSLEVHDVVLDKLMWEYTKNRINRVFGKDYVQIIDFRMEGYTLKYSRRTWLKRFKGKFYV